MRYLLLLVLLVACHDGSYERIVHATVSDREYTPERTYATLEQRCSGFDELRTCTWVTVWHHEPPEYRTYFKCPCQFEPAVSENRSVFRTYRMYDTVRLVIHVNYDTTARGDTVVKNGYVIQVIPPFDEVIK